MIEQQERVKVHLETSSNLNMKRLRMKPRLSLRHKNV